jgi:hypothetical protein
MRWKSGAEIEEKGARGCDCDQLTIAERIAEVTGALGDDIARCLSNPKLLVTQTIAIVRRVTERNPRKMPSSCSTGTLQRSLKPVGIDFRFENWRA